MGYGFQGQGHTGREGEVAKGTVTIISNTRRGSGDEPSVVVFALRYVSFGFGPVAAVL